MSAPCGSRSNAEKSCPGRPFTAAARCGSAGIYFAAAKIGTHSGPRDYIGTIVFMAEKLGPRPRAGCGSRRRTGYGMGARPRSLAHGMLLNPRRLDGDVLAAARRSVSSTTGDHSGRTAALESQPLRLFAGLGLEFVRLGRALASEAAH